MFGFLHEHERNAWDGEIYLRQPSLTFPTGVGFLKANAQRHFSFSSDRSYNRVSQYGTRPIEHDDFERPMVLRFNNPSKGTRGNPETKMSYRSTPFYYYVSQRFPDEGFRLLIPPSVELHFWVPNLLQASPILFHGICR